MKSTEDPQVPKHRAHKPTRHWCRGRVGVSHEWRWTEDRKEAAYYKRFISNDLVISKLACASCGKEHPDSYKQKGLITTHNRGHGRVVFFGPAFGVFKFIWET